MWHRRIGAALLGGILLAPSAAPAQAQGRDPVVTPACGGWLIFVKSYSGDQARDTALGLVNEIRTKYKMPAYYFNYGAEEKAREQARVERLREQQIAFMEQMGMPLDKIRYKKLRVEEQYGVLIGGWRTMDDARKALETVRGWPAPSKKFVDVWVSQEALKEGMERDTFEPTLINPFKTAWVTPNPAQTHQQDDPLAKVNDPVIKRMNSGIDHSILDCPKKWTLMVKMYHAPAVIQTSGSESVMSKLGLESSENSYLEQCAKQAHGLAEILEVKLRGKLGVPAYVMHTQYASIVSVGAYDSPNDPGLLRAQRALANYTIQEVDGKTGQPTGRVLETLTEQPLPMPVPFRD